ncbi:hypothetical protein A3SI_16400 [Nitritalea halalkaliphila LW7]|uniref:Class IIb bacteriocin, lactobin A/cerein 7B family n=1 Tax=Nitritalea halalkaliphila LW7 TaxID=1189621 RepID=I5BWZ3_9BACT|nr:class IIb bacteriocin, lactobin A/cerein 7B family [Nitritalea halalkaliphila]EIM74095.1 hypothetical protein A3SI_16400 [Nitritalea halalkaliphila LW7]
MRVEVLNDRELTTTKGGILPLAVAWGICKGVCVLTAGAYGAGYAVGKAYAHYKNSQEVPVVAE